MSAYHIRLEDFPPSLRDFFRTYALPYPRKGTWRMCDYRVGQIEHLPGSRGIIHATDGVLCYIVRGDGDLFVGHLDHWLPDDEQPVELMRRAPQSERRESAKRRRIMEEYV